MPGHKGVYARLLYIAAMLVHTYMGTIGTPGAFEGMATGEVDVNWAKSHHALWFEEETKRSRSASLAATAAAPKLASS